MVKAALSKRWAPLALILAVALVGALLPGSPPQFDDFKAGDERKQAFIAYFVPLITAENARIRKERESALAWRNTASDLNFWQRRSLHSLAEKYGLSDFDEQNDESWEALLSRVDTVPASLAIAQAANESAWGTSRFAREGNNYYGQWCYRAGCGLVPKNRVAGKSHEVARFASPAESVDTYIANLNRNAAYAELRALRRRLEQNGGTPSGIALADGLVKYSERGQAYVQDIQRLIENNALEQYDAGGS